MRVLEQSSVEEGDAKVHTCGLLWIRNQQSAANRRPAQLCRLAKAGQTAEPELLGVEPSLLTESWLLTCLQAVWREQSWGTAPCPAGGLPQCTRFLKCTPLRGTEPQEGLSGCRQADGGEWVLPRPQAGPYSAHGGGGGWGGSLPSQTGKTWILITTLT